MNMAASIVPQRAASGAPVRLSAAPADVAALVMHEADLLDERALDAWLALYTQDALYWVPADHGDSDPLRRVSLFYDDRSIMEDRVWRLGHPKMFSQNPPARQVRVLSTPMVEASGPGTMSVRTKFVMFEHRLREQRTFGGVYLHELVRLEEAWMIRRKVVHLVNRDTVLWNIGVPI